MLLTFCFDQVKTQLLLTSPEQEMALAKVITWTYEPKSAEVRRQSQAALVALFQLNPAHFTRVMQALPKLVQENAAGIVSFAVSQVIFSSRTTDADFDCALKTHLTHQKLGVSGPVCLPP